MLSYLRSVADRFLRRSNVDDEMAEEVRSHIQHRADDLERAGLSRPEAERKARVEFGSAERVKEEMREQIGGDFLDVLIQDIRFSTRVLRKTPGFTAIAVSTLALAIGANALVFGVMNAIVLRPLDLPRPESLYGLENSARHSMYESYPDYVDLRDRNRSFESLAAFNIVQAGLDTGESPTRAWGYTASGNFFDALGIQPHIGRMFHASDEHGPNSAPYIVLGYGFWHSRFHDDPGVVGRTIRVNKHPYTVVGVAPADFHGIILFFHPDFYVPLVNEPQLDGSIRLEERMSNSGIFMTLGHLKPGVTPEQATADLNSVGDYLARTYPREHGATSFRLARPGLYGNYLGSPTKMFLSGLMGLAALILLAACANLGNLFAARAADRAREVALRLALGASRTRIVRQLLTEATLVSLAGGALGLWGSIALMRAMNAWRPIARWPVDLPVAPGGNVYAMAFGLALLSALLFGMVPVRQALRTDPYQIVKAGRSVTRGRRITAPDLLLAAQIAICAVLVTASMVAVRGLARSLNSDFGFRPRNVIVADTDLGMAGYTREHTGDIQDRLIAALKAVPGVTSAGTINRLPLNGGAFGALVFRDDVADLRPENAVLRPVKFGISPEYFEAAGTSLLAGREFTRHDDSAAPRVAIVNREFATRMFGSAEGSIGSLFKLRDGARLEVVGVVEDGKYLNLAEERQAALFVPSRQSPSTETWMLVRSPRDPEQLAGAIRDAVRGVDAGLPVYLETWTKQLDFALLPSRLATVSLGVMGAIGAVLAITGIFGMAAYSVSRRLKELGIRIALGAQGRQVLRAALGRAFRLLAFGSAAGIALGLLASKVLAYIVYQASPWDPVVLACVLAVMLLVGLGATWIPARRALSVDPLKLLREE